MTHRTRRQCILALAILLATSFVAAPAFASHGHRYKSNHHAYRSGGHHGFHARHHVRHHNYGPRVRVVHRRSYPTYVHEQRSEAYYCAPCNHRFDSHDALYQHVHRRHHVALWRLPFVIVKSIIHGTLGWIFHG